MKKILMIVSAAIAILFSFSLLDIEGNKANASTVGEQLKAGRDLMTHILQLNIPIFHIWVTK